jgi:hypothetical protein
MLLETGNLFNLRFVRSARLIADVAADDVYQ